MEAIETIIIGGGQAGLSASYYLKEAGREHIVLEKAPLPANPWRNERWDSFTLVTPNWVFNIPGANLKEADRDKFMPLKDVISFFENYVERHNLPVMFNKHVTSVEPNGDQGYFVRTEDRIFKANNVVVATGFYQKPKIPLAFDLPENILQIPSSKYRNPDSLPVGAVLIIGSGQSGSQIAEELYKSGRKVFLSTGRAIRAPRRYRGKDAFEWLNMCRFFDMTPDQLPPGRSRFDGIPHLSGTNGGHTLNLHNFAREGVTLLGHVREIRGSDVSIVPDLHKNLEIIDHGELFAVSLIDAYISANHLNVPPDELPRLRDGYEQPVIEKLNLKNEGISSIIWARGFSFDYSFVKVPVCDREGFPIQTSGVTNYKGLYFVGMPWMPYQKSGFLLGVGDCAKSAVSKIAGVN